MARGVKVERWKVALGRGSGSQRVCWAAYLSWRQSPSAVILDPPKIKSVTVFIVSPSIFHDIMGLLI